MKQFYPHLLLPALKQSILVFVVFLSASTVSNAQIYWANLSGPAESPSNNSPGTGKALVTIDGNNMRVQVSFQDS